MKQEQHVRRYRSGKKVTVNRGRVKVKTYKRTVKNKTFSVAGYKRKKRGMGKKIRYHKVGEFYLGHDELGNIRGSRVVPMRKRSRMSRDLDAAGIARLDTQYVSGGMPTSTWLRKRKKLIRSL